MIIIKVIIKSYLLALLSVLFFTIPSLGQGTENLPDHKLSEWSIGDHLFGEKVNINNLKGRVVVIENWGLR